MTDSRPGSFKKEAPAFFKDGGTDETKNSGNDESSSARSMSPQFRKQQQALLARGATPKNNQVDKKSRNENGGRGASIDRPASSVVDIDVNPSQRDLKIGKAGPLTAAERMSWTMAYVLFGVWMLLIGPGLLLWMLHAIPGLGGFSIDVWVPTRCSKEGYDAASDILCPQHPDYEEPSRRW